MAAALAALAGLPAGPAQAARSGLHAAQEPPLVVPDSAPVAPDPAPIAPDPAPSPPDSESPPASNSPAPAPPPQSFEPQPTPAPVAEPAAAGATRGDAPRNANRARTRAKRTRNVARDPAGNRYRKGSREQPPSIASADAAVTPLRGFDSDGHRSQLVAAGLALLALVLLSGAFLGYVSPLVRERRPRRR